MVRVLFVCLGNICRSPTAEGVCRQRVVAAGLDDQFAADSAGTSDFNAGSPPDPRAIAEAAAHGIDLSGLRARRETAEDFDCFDLVLAMDRANRRDLRRLAPADAKGRPRLLLDYAPALGRLEIPDPFLGGPADYRLAFELIAAGVDGLLDALRRPPD
ncbi:MAG: low molecular weight protein-tyrosine-phosphatase [Dongiaceae bacterium]